MNGMPSALLLFADAVANDADVWVMLGGGFPLIGIMVFMLRRPKLDALADERGLQVGGRVIPWPQIHGLQYGRSDARPFHRVLTDQGVVELGESDLAQDPLLFEREIAQRAGLQTLAAATPPRELASRRVTRYAEWAPPPGPAPIVELPVASPHSIDVPAKVTKSEDKRGWLAKLWGGVVAVVALLIKIGKVALVGGLKVLKLGKLGPTAWTMLLTAWVYAQAWGWRFAVGLVLLIFVHEMGHAVVIRAKGLRTSPIVFIPFFGAFIAMKDQLRDARTEAETAYGGPAAGTFGATACFGMFLVTGERFWVGLAYVGFMLNLFNLIPVSPLDGGRVVTAISPWLWVVGLVVAGTLGVIKGSPLLLIIVVLGAIRAFGEWKKRRNGESSSYYQLTPAYRVLMARAYFGLCGYLAWMLHRALELGGQATQAS